MANANWYTDRPRGALLTNTVYNADQHGHLENYDRAWGSRGLRTMNNSGSPNSQVDLSADLVALRSTTGYNVVVSSVSATCNLATAGPVVNGRDQSGAFAVNSWVHLYWIAKRDGTVATIASTVTPPTGPTLPTGYTHWTYADARRLNASGNLLKSFTDGAVVSYDENTSVVRVLASGTEPNFTNIAVSTLVPPNALRVRCKGILFLLHNTASAQFTANFRADGAQNNGAFYLGVTTQVVNITIESHATFDLPNRNQIIEYKMDAVPSGGGGAHLDILGYVLPNGDV